MARPRWVPQLTERGRRCPECNSRVTEVQGKETICLACGSTFPNMGSRTSWKCGEPCVTCGHRKVLVHGKQINRTGFTGVFYDRKSQAYYGRVRISTAYGGYRVLITKKADTAKRASVLLMGIIGHALRSGEFAQAAQRRWQINNAVRLSKIS